jgi:hypothetical protein
MQRWRLKAEDREEWEVILRKLWLNGKGREAIGERGGGMQKRRRMIKNKRKESNELRFAYA